MVQQAVQSQRVRTIEISVNGRPVQMPNEPGRDEANGAEIKAAAITQGVAIQQNFPLFQRHGSKLKPVRDDQVVHIRQHDEFVAVAPDDVS